MLNNVVAGGDPIVRNADEGRSATVVRWKNSILAWPRAWETGAARFFFTSAGSLVLFAGFLVVSIQLARDGNSGGFASLVFSQLFLVGLLAMLFSGRYVVRRRGRDAVGLLRLHGGLRNATVMLCARSARNFAYAANLSLLVLFVSLPVMVQAIPPDASWIDLRFRSVAPWAPVVGLYFVALLASGLVRKRRELGVGLSQDGIYHWSWFGCYFVPWSSVHDVEAVNMKVPRIRVVLRGDHLRSDDPEESWISRLSFFRRKKNLIDPMFLAVNPAVSYEVLRFYHQHPELRDELGSNTSVDRIRADKLIP